MGKRLVYFLVMLGALVAPRVTRASSLAPRHRPRCSMTTPAIIGRATAGRIMSSDWVADVAHLLPHMELGYAPLGFRTDHGRTEATLFHHGIVALKPSFTSCYFEAHLTGELSFGGERSEDQHPVEYGASAKTFGWRGGAEFFFRPSRFFDDRYRFADVLALGIGFTVGGILAIPTMSGKVPGWEEYVTLDKQIEFGPRALFDVNEWLGFVFSANLHVRPGGFGHDPDPPEIGLVLGSGIQLSFPAHSFLGEHHEDH